MRGRHTVLLWRLRAPADYVTAARQSLSHSSRQMHTPLSLLWWMHRLYVLRIPKIHYKKMQTGKNFVNMAAIRSGEAIIMCHTCKVLGLNSLEQLTVETLKSKKF